MATIAFMMFKIVSYLPSAELEYYDFIQSYIYEMKRNATFNR